MSSFWRHIDWGLVFIYLLLVTFGLVSIYSVEYEVTGSSLFDFSKNSGKQLIWIALSLVLALAVLLIDARFYVTFSYWIFGLLMVILVVTFLTAPEIKGARSWLVLGGIRFGQPSEFAKLASVLAIARYFDGLRINRESMTKKFLGGIFILIPTALVILQNDTGTAIVFLALVLALFREGIPWWVIILPVVGGVIFVAVLLQGFAAITLALAILTLIVGFFAWRYNKRLAFFVLASFLVLAGFAYGVNYAFHNVLKPHQQTRINVLIGKEADIQGAGYNVHQSLITIGSGGLDGKGFLQGTQTRGEFVPEQSTDFIFCTVGEEFGWLGSSFVVLLFSLLLLRVIQLAERQKSRFARVYGYGLVSVIFCHFFLNIAMTLGLFPVIGIPLPFFSYGGSSIIGFTILLFIFLKLDAGLKYDFG